MVGCQQSKCSSSWPPIVTFTCIVNPLQRQLFRIADCLRGSAPYWSNRLFLIFDILALSPERQSARMSKIKNSRLDHAVWQSVKP